MARTLKDTPKAKNMIWTLRSTDEAKQQGGAAYQRFLASMKRGPSVEMEGNRPAPTTQ